MLIILFSILQAGKVQTIYFVCILIEKQTVTLLIFLIELSNLYFFIFKRNRLQKFSVWGQSRQYSYCDSMNKPIFSFYYQNNPTKSCKDLDQVRSNATQRTSHLSSRSPTHAKFHYARKDQIKPTQPIIPKLPRTKQQKITTLQEINKPSLTFTSEEIEEPQQKPEQIGFLNWKVIGNFCGVSQKKQSIYGCACSNPCMYRIEWVKQVRVKDRMMFKKIQQVKVKSQNELQITKDIDRTYPNNPTFSKNQRFRQMLKEVLLAYSVYDSELGYVQGINLIAAILLYHIKSAQQTFWVLVQLLDHQELRLIYLGNLQHLRARCKTMNYLLSLEQANLYEHMMRLGINSLCFLDGWLLTLMSKVVPLQEMHLIIGNFKNLGWHYIYRLILCFIKSLKDYLLMTQDQSQFLMTLNQQSWKDAGIDWKKIIEHSKSKIQK